MKKMVLVLLTICSMSSAVARDSHWWLCQGSALLFGAPEKLVVSVFEHRSGASSRATDLTLIFGAFTLTGSFDTTDSSSGKVVLRMKKNYSYKGLVNFDYPSSTITLDGALVVGSQTKVKAVLECATLRD